MAWGGLFFRLTREGTYVLSIHEAWLNNCVYECLKYFGDFWLRIEKVYLKLQVGKSLIWPRLSHFPIKDEWKIPKIFQTLLETVIHLMTVGIQPRINGCIKWGSKVLWNLQVKFCSTFEARLTQPEVLGGIPTVNKSITVSSTAWNFLVIFHWFLSENWESLSQINDFWTW